MVGNGLHPCGPCRCACTGKPAPNTTGGFLEAWAARPPAVPDHRLPTQGARDGGCHSHSAGRGHLASPSSLTHAAAQYITAWRGTKFRRLQ